MAQAVADNVSIENVDIRKLQNTLMGDDCFLPWQNRRVSALSKRAECSAEVVRNGVERGEKNLWIGKEGDVVEYRFEKDEEIREFRLVFDNDLNRRYHNMPCNIPLVQESFKLPKTLITSYRIEGVTADGEVQSLTVEENHQRFVRLSVDWRAKTVRFVPLSTNGSDDFRLYSFEIA